MVGASKRDAVRWARKEFARLTRNGRYSRQAALNTVFKDACRKFSIGCAHAIEKALRLTYRDETEEEARRWEEGRD